MARWTLYMIRLQDGALYTGITTDVQRRFAQHQSGGRKAARYLRGKGPLRLVYEQPVGSRSAALQAEAAVKKLPKSAKEALLAGTLTLDQLLNTNQL